MRSPTRVQAAPTVAVIGGGQLARMLAEPAAAMGIPLRLLAEADGVSAAQVIPDQIVGDHTDLAALRKVTEGCEVVTFDHEHVPTEHLHALAADGIAVRPGPEALVHAQDKGVMRERLTELGIPCPRHALVGSVADVEAFGLPCVLKTTRGGYDGKGVWFVDTPEDCAAAFDSGREILAEERVDFRRELSALVARSPVGTGGRLAGGRLHPARRHLPRGDRAGARTSTPPWRLEAQRIAMTVAGELGVTGVLAVELFETADGRVLVNELAMRPHNTGHWTQDGAVTSQFENHLRAVLDLPLGAPHARERWTVMVNILGGSSATGRLYDGYPHALARDPRLRVHLYGKDLRPGRKVGHVNAYGDDLEDCLERARHAAAWFAGDLGEESANECRHRDGVRLGLAGDEGRRRGVRGVRRRLRGRRRLRAPDARRDARLRSRGSRRGHQGDHRRRRGSGPPAGHAGRGHAAAGHRGAGGAEVPRRHGLPALHRADACRGARGHGGRRQRAQRRPARRTHPGGEPTPTCSRR